MKVFVTGGSGFIGSYLVKRLANAGHTVSAPSHRELDVTRMEPALLAGADTVIHLAAVYEIGSRDRRAMYATNVLGTRAVLDAAIAARIPRIVHVSSTAALGDTRGALLDETHRHDGTFRSHYEETKHIAHGLALARVAAGAPIMIAIPGGAFGDGDASVLAQTLRDCRRGKLPIQVATTSRFQLCHVERLVDGLVKITTAGKLGQSYLLTGASFAMPELLARVAKLATRKPPRAIPARMLSPLATIADALRLPLPLSREALRVMDGSTYTYRSDKARRELGWDPGDVDADLTHYLASL
jgi:dihydroflavonol-4-reductase